MWSVRGKMYVGLCVRRDLDLIVMGRSGNVMNLMLSAVLSVRVELFGIVRAW